MAPRSTASRSTASAPSRSAVLWSCQAVRAYMAFRARRGVALMRHLVVGKRLLAQVSAMLQPTPRNPDRAALLEALTELRGAGITSASSTQEHQRMGTVSNQRASELPRRQLWVAYVVGAFGLGLAHQANFLTPLRAHELGA